MLKSVSFGADLLKDEKIDHAENKKHKIALLNEADFMVKLKFESWNYCFANIRALVTWVK